MAATARQLTHSFALMLWAAAALAFLAKLPQLGAAIVVVVVLNALFAFVEEHRADRAAEELHDLLPRRATVVRSGRTIDVDAAQLVPDDLVVLTAGDRVSADLRAVEAHALSVDTSMLTGESVPAVVDDGGELFAGTFVTEGEGVALVTGTGRDTRLAQIATLTQAGPQLPSPLTRELHRVVRTIATIAIGLGAAFFGVALLVGTAAAEAVVFAIGVTVALVPEGPLPTVTLSLAIGAQRMAQRHALVRRLDAVETLGSTTFVCTDKTGTLTSNEMQVVEVWTPAGAARITGVGYQPTATLAVDADEVTPALHALATAGARCSNGHAVLRNGQWHAQGDPMEAALRRTCQSRGHRRGVAPFTSRVCSGRRPPGMGAMRRYGRRLGRAGARAHGTRGPCGPTSSRRRRRRRGLPRGRRSGRDDHRRPSRDGAGDRARGRTRPRRLAGALGRRSPGRCGASGGADRSRRCRRRAPARPSSTSVGS